MVYKLFLSHSSLDTALVAILRSLRLPGIELYLAEDDPQYGDPLSENIAHEIDSSDAVVAFLTKHGGESPSVNQEVGYAKRAHKRIIAVIEEGAKVGVLIQGVEIIRFSKDRIEDAIKLFIHYVMPKAKEKSRNRLLGIGLLLAIAVVVVVVVIAVIIWKIPSVFSRKKRSPTSETTNWTVLGSGRHDRNGPAYHCVSGHHAVRGHCCVAACLVFAGDRLDIL